MARVNEEGYLERQNVFNRKTFRDWWIVKHNGMRPQGVINVYSIHLPLEYVGKRVRFRAEVLE